MNSKDLDQDTKISEPLPSKDESFNVNKSSSSLDVSSSSLEGFSSIRDEYEFDLNEILDTIDELWDGAIPWDNDDLK